MALLVLIRHGESVWNRKNIFTGWVDVPLSEKGISEALKAGEKLSNIQFDVVFTSLQIRAIQTALLALSKNNNTKTPVIIHPDGKMADWSLIHNEQMKLNIIPVYEDWHLNERYYGRLQGSNKLETAELYGHEKVHQWRRSYDVPPPEGECLKDTAERTIPFFQEHILSKLKEGNNVFVSAHGNSLRSIVMFIEQLTQEEVLNLEIPTGLPLIYTYSNNKLVASGKKDN